VVVDWLEMAKLAFHCIYISYAVFPYVISVMNFSYESFCNIMLLFDISVGAQLRRYYL